MAFRTTLNARSLEALGAPCLAELLMEISTGDAAIKRRLRLELASLQSPGDVAREVRKRLKTIARSRPFIDWQKLKPFIYDLEMQRRAIIAQQGEKARTVRLLAAGRPEDAWSAINAVEEGRAGVDPV